MEKPKRVSIEINDLGMMGEYYDADSMDLWLKERVVLDEERVTKILYDAMGWFGEYDLVKKKMPNATGVREAEKLAQALCSRAGEIVK